MSSNNVATSVRNLSKCYQIYDTPRDRLKQFILPRLQGVLGREQARYYHEFFALNDISFELKKGETVGIIGVNGSGKSTLLQMICGTLSPTGGHVETRGRVAALLELGSGFNPEFTGRENVHMNAAILGLSKEEIALRFDSIVEFADIGPFIEQPIKMYSSGMVIRLAFAIAINVDPQILVIDEALAVGDAAFQRKCFSRLKAIQDNGATILFVSHDAGSIVELCNKAILLDQGKKLYMGTPKKVVTLYQKLLFASHDQIDSVRQEIVNNIEQNSTETNECDDTLLPAKKENDPPEKNKTSSALFNEQLVPKSTTWYDSNGAIIKNPHITTLNGRQVNMLIRNEEYFYIYDVHFLQSTFQVKCGMLIKTMRGVEIGGYGNTVIDDRMEYVTEGSIIQVRFRFTCALLPGVYFMNVGLLGTTDQGESYLHRGIDVIMFEILPEKDIAATAIVDFGIKSKIFFKHSENA